jgi:YihY family inner membrane protein
MFKGIFTVPTEELGRWSRFAVLQLKLWRHCAKLLRQNRAGTQAAALSYHTIFGIVPLAIVMVMVFQAIPAYRDVGDKVRLFFYEQMNLDQIMYPADETNGDEDIKLTDKIDETTDNYIDRLNTGAITLFSGGIVIWAALGLLTTIERSFNSIWHVGRGRNFMQRIVNYWALMTLGPFLLVLGFYVSTHYLVTEQMDGNFLSRLQPILPYLISVAFLFLLYFVLPNTRVSIRAAIWGAVIAALIWTGAKMLFTMYMARFEPYKGVYGAISIIPLSVFWIWVTWLIVLFGLQLTYTTQHLKSLNAAEIAATQKTDEHFLINDFTVIKILEYIFDEFEKKHGPVPADTLCARMDLPAEFGSKILDHLVAKGLLVQTAEPHVGYMPATDGEKITLADIADVVQAASFDQNLQTIPPRLKKIMDQRHEELAKVTLKEVLEEESA